MNMTSLLRKASSTRNVSLRKLPRCSSPNFPLILPACQASFYSFSLSLQSRSYRIRSRKQRDLVDRDEILYRYRDTDKLYVARSILDVDNESDSKIPDDTIEDLDHAWIAQRSNDIADSEEEDPLYSVI